MVLAVLGVGLLVAGALEYYEQLRSFSDSAVGNPAAVRANLAEAGISVGFYAAYLLALDVVFAAVGFAVAILIFWRKSAEPVALLVALSLVSGGGDASSAEALAASNHVADWLNKGLSLVNLVSLFLFLYIFPDGRFAPRWTRWLMAASAAVVFLQTFSPNTPLDWDSLVFGLLISGVLAQIYRYRRVSGPAERRKTKWVVFGVTVGISGFLATIMLPVLLTGAFPATGTLGDLFGRTIMGLFVLLIPLSIGVAVLRSGLFDIDVIINRTIVYGLLTLSLALIYFGSVVVPQRAFVLLTGEDSQLTIVASTLTIAALFIPLRRLLQRAIDRRFYRRKYDAAKTLAAFSEKLRDETDLNVLNEELVTAAREALQPESVSLWLREQERDGKLRTDG